jgi:alginate O-acetyltransferase complex protein AlgI
MSFVTVEFALLLASVLTLLGLVRSAVGRKCILLSASCFFYAYWDWRFLGLLATVTIVDYYVSRFLVTTESARTRRALLTVSIVTNLGFLGFFKYFDFFLGTLNHLLTRFGWRLEHPGLTIILPIGISFYTFETLSYVIDIYRGDARPARSMLDYAIFITFFPRLVAGPIMRAHQFLPQLEHGMQLTWSNLAAGAQLFVRGMVKKMVVADNMATMADRVYTTPHLFSSGTVWLGVLAYSVQIFFDFSGYTDMALGVGRMLGFRLPENFNLPYTAQSITEFWQRWHISLSTWLRDYVYVSFGGNRRGRFRTYMNLMATMLLGGLWHGASWNFVVWGGLHGAYLAIERAVYRGRPAIGSWNSPSTWLKALGVFLLVSVTWVFFRSPSFEVAGVVLRKLLFLSAAGLVWPYSWALIAVPAVVLGGFVGRAFEFGFRPVDLRSSYAIPSFIAQILLVCFLSPLNVSPFIYFQF